MRKNNWGQVAQIAGRFFVQSARLRKFGRGGRTPPAQKGKPPALTAGGGQGDFVFLAVVVEHQFAFGVGHIDRTALGNILHTLSQ